MQKGNGFGSAVRCTALGAGVVALVGLGFAGCATPSSDANAAPGTETGSVEPMAQVYEDELVELTIPAGTVLDIELGQTLSSSVSQAGDRFEAFVVNAVEIEGAMALEAGSTVRGKVLEAVPSKKIGGAAKLAVEFMTVAPTSGDEAAISATFHDKAKSQTKKDAATIGGATAGGALLGRIIGHQKGQDADGTTIGAIVGAAVGTAVAASNTGEDVVISEGTMISIQLDRPVKLEVPRS